MPRWPTPIRCLPSPTRKSWACSAGRRRTSAIAPSPNSSPIWPKSTRKDKRAAQTEAAKRTPFQTAIFNLRNSLVLYQQLKNSIQPARTPATSAAEINTYAECRRRGCRRHATRHRPARSKNCSPCSKPSVARYEAQAQAAICSPWRRPPAARSATGLTTGAALLRVESTRSHPRLRRRLCRHGRRLSRRRPCRLRQGGQGISRAG